MPPIGASARSFRPATTWSGFIGLSVRITEKTVCLLTLRPMTTWVILSGGMPQMRSNLSARNEPGVCNTAVLKAPLASRWSIGRLRTTWESLGSRLVASPRRGLISSFFLFSSAFLATSGVVVGLTFAVELEGEPEEEGLLSPPNSAQPPMARATTATAASPMPRTSIVEPLPLCFFCGLASSSSSSSPGRRAGLPLPGAGFLLVAADPDLPFLAGPASSSSSASSGSSTTKRYLHLGQSIFRPTSLGSRIGTIASQLGHCCLKLL